MINNHLDRLALIIGDDKIKCLQNKNIIVFGIGGVGGYVCEFLVRSGITKITIVDFDVISPSNLNRQIIALSNNIGKSKVEEMKQRLLLINPELDIKAIEDKLEDNISDFKLENYDYVIDAVDDVKAKVNLIRYCNSNKINLICSLGTGNRFGIPSFMICDIYQTENDALAKKLRNLLRKEGVKSQNVCFSTIPGQKCASLGSSVQFPCAAACVIVGFVLDELLKEN